MPGGWEGGGTPIYLLFAIRGRAAGQECTLFDFENGRLDGWTLTGTAFNNQPTYGDNPRARGRNPSNVKGDWFVGTYDNRPSPSHPAGGKQGNGPTGTATSPQFVIQGTKLRFLIGGGSDTKSERLELLIGGSVVDSATSRSNRDGMEQREFDVSSFRGRVAQFRIVDESSYDWGIINVDHIEDNYCTL
ncbi:hypothetical protein AC249_AIPGENE29052 [Exaiptasia diaphana]|nr:hypothetical protein AC249_AIPGENE29052 [Exaiptasia diaphana]